MQYVRAAQGNGEGNSQDGQQEAYCHFVGTDSRLDEWLPFERFLRTSEQPHPDSREASPTDTRPRDGGMAQPDLKRKRTRETKSVEVCSASRERSFKIADQTTYDCTAKLQAWPGLRNHQSYDSFTAQDLLLCRLWLV